MFYLQFNVITYFMLGPSRLFYKILVEYGLNYAYGETESNVQYGCLWGGEKGIVTFIS